MKGVSVFLKRNSSTILSFVSAAGVVATAVLAAKETPRAVTICERVKEESDEEPTKLDYLKATWKCYIPAASVGFSTIACILSANALNKKQQAALIGAYTFGAKAFNEYKEKAKELFGDKADHDIRSAIVKNKVKDSDFEEPIDGNLLFYDEYSGEYFERTLVEVQDAEYQLNRKFVVDGYVKLNEFYELLDLSKTDTGNAIGWSTEAGIALYDYQWIDIKHELVELDDGLECYILNFLSAPTIDYRDY